MTLICKPASTILLRTSSSIGVSDCLTAFCKNKHQIIHLASRVKSGLAEKRGSKDITNRTINCKPTCTMGTTDSHTSSLIPSQSSEVLGFLSSPGRQFPFEIICTMGSNRSSHADTRFIQKPSTDQLLRSSF